MHYYSHHIGDYQPDTSTLPLIEHGAYRLLMDACYVSKQPLPADLPTLCRICRAFSKAERDAVAAVVARFFVEENGLLHHPGIEAEIGHFQKISATRSENGRLGGIPRGKLTESNPKPNALLTESKTKAKRKPTSTQEPRTINQEPALELRERAGSYPSVDEVRAQASLIAAPPECAERFWNDCEAVGWVNRHGQPIADWRPLFRNFATQWLANANTAQPKVRQSPFFATPQRNDSANRPGRYAIAGHVYAGGAVVALRRA